MRYVPLLKSDIGAMSSDQDLQRWIKDNKVQAIYVDRALREFDSTIWELIENQVGLRVCPKIK